MKLAKPDTLADQTELSPGPAQKMERQDLADSIMSQVATLSSNQQEVLRLKFHGGLTYTQIANVTGLSKTNVGVLLHTAISKLRQRVGQD